ncbi:fibronectin type III domain-containing protein [Bacillus cereus]|uniref:fibronectin type III domain-containing protein n=1 Tax=Bacillus cereus TaxID=1396 RepID=UPI003D645B7D
MYFEDKLIVKKYNVDPEPVKNLLFSNITSNSATVTFDPSPSGNVVKYEITVAYTSKEPHERYETEETTFELTGLSPSTYYDIRVIAWDVHDNNSGAIYNYFRTSRADLPPNVDSARIETQDTMYGFSVTCFSFEGASEIDVYFNGVLARTLPTYGSSNASFGLSYGEVEPNVEFEIKAIAKNQYGEAKPVVITAKVVNYK